MNIAIASDHAGFKIKEALKKNLSSMGCSVFDFGTNSESSVDYPDFAKKVATAVSEKNADRGVLICGSGIGMCIGANRFNGIRAVVINDKFDAEMSRKHNDCNVACFGARKLSEEKIIELLQLWLKTEFEGGRHEERVKKLEL